MTESKKKKIPCAVKALIAVICVIAVFAAGEIISMGYRSDSEDVIAYETDNPFVAADGNTLISAHRSGGGIMPEETMMHLKTVPKMRILPLTGLNLIFISQKTTYLFCFTTILWTEHLTAKRFSEKKKYAQRIKHTRNSECSTWAQNLKMKTAKCLMQI